LLTIRTTYEEKRDDLGYRCVTRVTVGNLANGNLLKLKLNIKSKKFPAFSYLADLRPFCCLYEEKMEKMGGDLAKR